MQNVNAGGNEITETSSIEYAGRGTTGERKSARRILIEALAEKDGWACGVCHRTLGDGDIHLDHRVALSAGGDDSFQNLQLAHPFCNLQKGNGLPRRTIAVKNTQVLTKREGTKHPGGRPRVHGTNAERQRAYRERGRK